MNKKLTDKQRAVFEFIRGQIRDRGLSPTIREIGQRFGISSTNGVRLHLSALIKKGYLRKHPLISRGLELTQSLVGEVGRLPLVGSVPAGTPIDAVENHEGEIAVDRTFLPKGDTFTLRVIGDSMKDAGIFDKDFVIVRKQQVARSGEIVVAIIGGEATVKRYYPEGKQVRLQPAKHPIRDSMLEFVRTNQKPLLKKTSQGSLDRALGQCQLSAHGMP